MTEQTMAFCQVLLKRTLVDNVINDPYHLGWTKIVKDHEYKFPLDPLPFPFDDPDPQVYTPLSKEYPWHTQIHRDAFGYGQVPNNIDQRLVVDLRFFGYVKPIYDNYVEFKPGMTDGFGMPQVCCRCNGYELIIESTLSDDP
jgi:pyranose oxidase